MHWLEESGVIAVVRLDNLDNAVRLAASLVEGGVTTVEFTYTNRAAGLAIEQVRTALGNDCRVGAGTVLDAETARSAIIAGAEFIVTPAVRPATIEIARRYGIPSIIGAFTPTEILTAWEQGADFIKVFPATSVGPAYIKEILGPLPQVKLVPSGGVSLETAPAYLRAGAAALAVGGQLIDRTLVVAEDWAGLTARARAWSALIAARDAR